MATKGKYFSLLMVAVLGAFLNCSAISPQVPTNPSEAGILECEYSPEVCRTFDRLFPLVVSDTNWVKNAASFIVVGRVLPGHNTSLFYFVFEKDLDGAVRVRFATTTARFWTVLENHLGDLDKRSVRSLQKILDVRYREVTSQRCGDLKSLAKAIEELRLEAVPPGDFFADPTQFQVGLFSRTGVTYFSAKEPPLGNPLRLWVETLRDLLERDGESGRATSTSSVPGSR